MAGLPEQKSESKPKGRCCSSLDGSIFHTLRQQLLLSQRKVRTCADNVSLFANVGMYVLVYWPEDKIRGWDAGMYWHVLDSKIPEVNVNIFRK